jgi:hypothetical protein
MPYLATYFQHIYLSNNSMKQLNHHIAINAQGSPFDFCWEILQKKKKKKKFRENDTL